METPENSELSGILLIDKPAHITSHDVVYRLRRLLNVRRIGHAGTLDPLATGLLIMLIGKATKLSQFFVGFDKTYSGTMKFGEVTDSYDSDGNIIETRDVNGLNLEKLSTLAGTFEGELEQIPPMFSAKKLNGRPLYKLARKGHIVERKPVKVNIYNFKIANFYDNKSDFFIHCSKGTYVRSLVHDFGQKLGCGAHLCALRRESVGQFNVKNAVTLDKISTLSIAEIQDLLVDQSDFSPKNI